MPTLARYREVLEQLSAGQLALLAVRRAYRGARVTLARNGVAPAAAALLQAYGVEGPEALVREALEGTSLGAWCDAGRQASVRAALARIPGARERAQARAEAVLAGRFTLYGHSFTVAEGASLPWHEDVRSGHRWPQAPVHALAYEVPGADPKLPWELGRLDALVALAQGAWVAPERAGTYAQAAVRLLEDFLAHNPPGHGIQWACPMEVALRAANIAQALRMLARTPEVRAPDFLARALTSLAAHTAWVEAHLEDSWSVVNNHLVADYVGLLTVAALFPRLPRARAHALLAARGLRREMEAQVHADGVSFEGSLPYHRLALELFTLGWLSAREAGLPLGEEYRERLERMFAVTRHWCSEEGRAPQLGDNDSGRAFALCERDSLDHGYLAPLGAALLASPALKAEGARLPEEAAWLLGEEGLTRFASLASTPQPRLFSSPLGGVHVLRGAGAVVTVSAGPAGQKGVGGHSHNDRLSFELHLEGRPLLVDCGTGCYTRDAAERNHFRGTAAHNTLMLDGEEQSPFEPSQLFALPDRAWCTVTKLAEAATSLCLVARHSGYWRLSSPVTHQRGFLLDETARALRLQDVLHGEGPHEATLRFHLAPDVEAQARPATEGERAQARALCEGRVQEVGTAVLLSREGRPLATLLLPEGAEVALERAPYSPGYGERTETRVVVARLHLVAPTCLTSALLF